MYHHSDDVTTVTPLSKAVNAFFVMCYKRGVKCSIETGQRKGAQMKVNDMTMMRHLSNNEANRITRESICTALLSLMETREFEKITITELVRKAGVSRQSFYRNYTTKEDIIFEIEDELMTVFSESLKETKYEGNMKQWFHDFFSFMKENRFMVSVLHKANLSEVLLAKFSRIVEKQTQENSADIHYYITGVMGGLRAIAMEWFLNGMQESEDEMSAVCAQLIQNGLKIRMQGDIV